MWASLFLPSILPTETEQGNVQEADLTKTQHTHSLNPEKSTAAAELSTAQTDTRSGRLSCCGGQGWASAVLALIWPVEGAGWVSKLHHMVSKMRKQKHAAQGLCEGQMSNGKFPRNMSLSPMLWLIRLNDRPSTERRRTREVQDCWQQSSRIFLYVAVNLVQKCTEMSLSERFFSSSINQ